MSSVLFFIALVAWAYFAWTIEKWIPKSHIETKPARREAIGRVTMNIHLICTYEGHPVRLVMTPYNTRLMNGEEKKFLLTNN